MWVGRRFTSGGCAATQGCAVDYKTGLIWGAMCSLVGCSGGQGTAGPGQPPEAMTPANTADDEPGSEGTVQPPPSNGGADMPPAPVDIEEPGEDPTETGFIPGKPIDAALGEWTWVDVPEARCMGDDSTGMHFNRGASDKLVILMEGGGACYNPFTCGLSLAIHPFGASEVDTPAITAVYGNNLFDRDNPDNPIRDWSYVFFPYCSGDVFAGGASDGTGYQGRTHRGFYNVDAYLRRLVATFPEARKVLLTGVSAGGFGAAFNYDQVAQAFGPQASVYLLDDSGPPMAPQFMAPCLQERWREAWGLDSIMPPEEECPGCRDPRGDLGLVSMVQYLVEKYPQGRFGLVSSEHDAIIREFFSFGRDECAYMDSPLPVTFMPPEEYAEGLQDLLDYAESFGGQMKGYLVRGAQSHTWLLLPEAFGGVEEEGVRLSDWLRQLVEDDPAWDHVGI